MRDVVSMNVQDNDLRKINNINWENLNFSQIIILNIHANYISHALH